MIEPLVDAAEIPNNWSRQRLQLWRNGPIFVPDPIKTLKVDTGGHQMGIHTDAARPFEQCLRGHENQIGLSEALGL